jgi:TonB family protein
MRKAEPPKPQPQSPPPPAPAPQVAQQQPPPPTQPPPPNQQALVEAPKPEARPAPTAPNFSTGPSTPGEAIRQAARAASQAPSMSGGGQGGPGGPNGPVGAGGAAIISDTMGVDFSAYLKRIVYDTERAWWPIIPEIARPPLNKQGRVLIRFKIMKDGTVKEMHLEGPSGDVSLDRAAWGGILGAAPFPLLPKDFKGDFIELRFYFLYNIKPGAE